MTHLKRTVPDLSLNSPTHTSALQDLKKHFSTPDLNVADRFKGLTKEEVNQQLRQTASPFAVLLEHWIHDLNLSSAIRNANAFNAREVFYIGSKRWDRRGAVGVYHYTPITWLSTMEEVIALKEKYTFVGIDNIPGSVSMKNFQWQPNTLFVFGEEKTGLTPGMQALCSALVHIDMRGSVRSLNCATASGIIMNDFVSKVL